MIAVAHSASGLMLASVAEVRPVRRLVFLAGVIPRIGMSFMDQFEANRELMFNPEWIGQDPLNDEQAALTFLFHDCEPEVALGADHTNVLVSGWFLQGDLFARVVA